MSKNVKMIFEIILVVLAIIIIVQNTTLVNLQVLFWDFKASLIILLILVLSLGMAIGYFLPKLNKNKEKEE
ncbi:hypothetical protein BMS3Abin03_00796 [bacterium BMS3Abin03]|nr:hypothetical protein BMS3Abin03_00796 [bacterium BMS3Abin03]